MKSATSPLLLALCLLASAATAARTDEGTWSMAGSLMVDSASYVGTEIDLDLSVGQYVRTGLLVGGYAGVWDNDLITTLEAGGTVKYHVLDSLASPFSPFIGADLGLANCSTEPDDAFALVLGARVGFDLFLTETVALEASLDAHVATDDVYTDDGDEPLTNNDIRLKAGLALFF
jgi:hypothetical protein